MNGELGAPLAQACTIARLLLVAALALCLVRLARGPSIADRVVALDTMAYAAVGLVAVQTVQTADEHFLRPALPLALLTFLATVAFARYLEKRAMGR